MDELPFDVLSLCFSKLAKIFIFRNLAESCKALHDVTHLYQSTLKSVQIESGLVDSDSWNIRCRSLFINIRDSHKNALSYITSQTQHIRHLYICSDSSDPNEATVISENVLHSIASLQFRCLTSLSLNGIHFGKMAFALSQVFQRNQCLKSLSIERRVENFFNEECPELVSSFDHINGDCLNDLLLIGLEYGPDSQVHVCSLISRSNLQNLTIATGIFYSKGVQSCILDAILSSSKFLMKFSFEVRFKCDVKSLVPLSNALEVLRLSGLKRVTFSKLLNYIKALQMPNMKKIIFSVCTGEDEFTVNFCQECRLPFYKKLYLSSNNPLDFTQIGFRNLEVLTLSKSGLCEMDLLRLKEIFRQLMHIKALYLRDNPDLKGVHISALNIYCPVLNVLDVYNTGLQHISDQVISNYLRRTSSLEKLSISHSYSDSLLKILVDSHLVNLSSLRVHWETSTTADAIFKDLNTLVERNYGLVNVFMPLADGYEHVRIVHDRIVIINLKYFF